jgi:ABC-type antimicrobial peptide transport system permease subunit
MSYAVSQSGRELGLRMALGATGGDLLRTVLLRGFHVTLAGICAGGAVALGLTRLMGDLLYRTSPRDPESFAAAFGIMVLVAAAACLLPARRAMRTDPVQALRGS